MTAPTTPSTRPAVPPEATAAGLSCYTANLAAYLELVDEDALDRIARSVHLAARPVAGGGLTFSHHHPDLYVLADGSELGWAWDADPDTALAGIAREQAAHGAVLVLADSAALPWSPVPAGSGAPHLLLVDGRGQGGLHVVDRFTAILPEGVQEQHEAVVDEAELVAITTQRPDAPAEHARRTALASGTARPVPPPGTHGWLTRRGPALPPPFPDDGAGWRRGPAEVLPFLRDHFAGLDEHPDRAAQLDDLWAAAQHHVFRSARSHASGRARELHERAAAAWTALPSALRFAADSARRGRPRGRLVTSTFDALLEAECALDPVPSRATQETR